MSAAPAPASGASRWAERLTVLILLGMAAVLAWMNVSLARRRPPPEVPPFDLRNTLLDARPGECVESYSPATPHDALCFRTVADGVVLRPSAGPDRRGRQDGLKRALPYLVLEMRQPEAGAGGCAGARAGSVREQLYPLGQFGIPAENPVRLDSIEAVYTESGGRERLVYLTVLEDYRQYYWKCYVDPNAPVTGLVRVDFATLKAGARAQQIYYSQVECP